MDDKRIMKTVDEDGIEREYEIICAFWLEKTKKHYIVYTDNTLNENKELNVFASIYYPEDDTKLDPVETEEEWNEIEKRLDFLKRI